MSYICIDCNHNNHGWCPKRKINGLKKLNLQECDDKDIKHKSSEEIVKFERIGVDHYGQPMISMSIGDKVAEFPLAVLKDFVADKNRKSIQFVNKE